MIGPSLNRCDPAEVSRLALGVVQADRFPRWQRWIDQPRVRPVSREDRRLHIYIANPRLPQDRGTRREPESRALLHGRRTTGAHHRRGRGADVTGVIQQMGRTHFCASTSATSTTCNSSSPRGAEARPLHAGAQVSRCRFGEARMNRSPSLSGDLRDVKTSKRPQKATHLACSAKAQCCGERTPRLQRRG